jgi:signal transduction histidine kinase
MKREVMGKPRKVHFKTHSDLKDVIGQDLINDDNIAIVELVKNGIDSGGSSISIEFLESEIHIEDDGSGMSASDLEDKWLNIAYSEKKYEPLGRKLLAGNKGVGRFACDRLGTRLDIYTRKNRSTLQHLEVDWTKFENKKELAATIQKIDIQLKEISENEAVQVLKRKPPKHGTLLIISGLRQNWNREKLMQLKRNLERFVNPIAVFDKGSVEVRLIAKAELSKDAVDKPHNRINGRIENQVFAKLKFKTTYIESTITPDGKTIVTELFHDGNRVYRLVEENKDFKLLKNIHVVVHYMNPYKKAYFRRQTGLNLVEFGSIYLFINGFRVPPYGDRNDDWLQLDNRKSQGTSRYLGNRELLGVIEITDPTRAFRIVSNREGVARDDRFKQLIGNPNGFFIQTLSRFERFIVDGLDWDSVPEDISKKLRAGTVPGDQDMPGEEIYVESGDRKRRRIALDVLRIVGADAENTKEFQIDPDLLDALSREREETVSAILERFDTYSNSIGHDVKLALNRVQEEFKKQKVSLLKAREEVSRKAVEVSRLKEKVKEKELQTKNLQDQVKTQQTELHFARLSSGSDQDQLMLLHHQSGLYAQTAKNFLDKAISQIRKNDDREKLLETIEKALLSTRKIIAVSSFATKAQFKLKTETITADIASFIREYLQNVASDGAAQNLKVSVTQDFEAPFVMRFRPIDIAIVFDNLASNSTRARAKQFLVHLSRPSENEIVIHIQDDGPGLSSDIKPPEKIFERGVTTTNGSGLGLYHVKQTLNQLSGDIALDASNAKGFSLVMRLMK